jgi:hypothetical protein
MSFASAQDRNNQSWNSRDGYLQTVQYGGYGNNNGDYQRGVQDGINSGRADANGNKRFNLGAHPYYTNSNNQAYREGFSQGYREAYGQGTGRNGNYGNNGRYNNNGYYNNGRYNNGHNNNNGYYDNNGHWHDRDRDPDHDHDRDHDWDHDHDNH